MIKNQNYFHFFLQIEMPLFYLTTVVIFFFSNDFLWLHLLFLTPKSAQEISFSLLPMFLTLFEKDTAQLK